MQNVAVYEEVPSLERVSAQLDHHRGELLQQYQQTLRETLFENRSQIRPSMLPVTAAREVESLIAYFQHPSPETARVRGVELCQQGFSEKTLLSLGSISRQFFLLWLENDLFPLALMTMDAYQTELLHGYVDARKNTILNEQAEIRHALLKSLSRYSNQMELAAGVALAINSVFDLNELLNKTVRLISQEFKLFYVGVFLLSDDDHYLNLSAGFGCEVETPVELPGDYYFEVGGDSLISQCMADRKPKITLELTNEISLLQTTWHPAGSLSAIASPLIARGKVIGAIVCYSQQASAFSDHDAAALTILSNQLANAIENAHLFSEIQFSEKKYRTILDTIEEGYYEMDLNGHFTFANDSVCAILGYPPADIINVDYHQFVSPDTMGKLDKAFERVLLTGKTVHGIEHKVIRKDGTSRALENYISLTQTLSGQPLGFRGILRDITRRKEAERYEIERQALERSNQELEQFAYVASHDLQEPLRKIQAFGDRLKTTNAARLDEDGLDSLNRMMKSANRMGVLISDLLNLSRVRTQADQFVPINLNLVLQDVLSDLDGLVERTGGTVHVEDLPVINADPLQMRQLMQNLIGNALKFHKPDQSPVIRVGCQIIGEVDTNAVCQITVADNGIGFDERYLERIFQPFQRLHTAKEYEGTGIGLSICRSIVERHHGQLTAHSVKGEGTTFIVTLPVYEKQELENHG